MASPSTTPSLTPPALPLSGLGLGVVVAIFSLVGFEFATAFGDEARDPLKSIPRAVVLSLIISGGFFVFVTYVMVQATQGANPPLDQMDAPLNVMAVLSHVPVLQAPLSLAALISFFALCLSCINAGGRIIFAMGRHGLFHSATAGAHHLNATPHVAVSVMAAVAFAVPPSCALGGVAPLDIFNYVGTMAAFGFLVPYVLITIAAPVYLAKLGQRRPLDMAVCVVSLALLVIPAVGSVYPVPPPPVTYLPLSVPGLPRGRHRLDHWASAAASRMPLPKSRPTSIWPMPGTRSPDEMTVLEAGPSNVVPDATQR